MASNTEFNFMSELQKKVLDQVVKGGLAVLLLFLFAWYQTNRIEAQEVKFETRANKYEDRIKEVEGGLLECEKARASLSQKVESLEDKISAFMARRR